VDITNEIILLVSNLNAKVKFYLTTMKKLTISSGLLCLLPALIFIMGCKEKLNPPTVSTTDATSVSYTTASSGGEVTSDGGDAVISRGICWGTNQSPTISDLKTSDGSGLGTFTSKITALTPNTLYYVRAYATNTAGTSYGNQVTFSSNPAGLTIKPASGKAGDIITIYGHFPNTMKIVLGGQNQEVLTPASDSIKFSVPDSFSAGAKDLKISENDKEIYTTQFTIYPKLTSVFNSTVTHDQLITVTGTGFSTTLSDNNLKLDGQPVNVISATMTQITGKIPINITLGAKKLSISVSSLNAVSSLDMKVYGWQKVTDHPRGGFYEIASFAINNNIFFCDGIKSGDATYAAELWKYNLTDNAWTRMADFPGTMSRYSVTCFAINGKGYMGLGDAPSPSNSKDFWEYDPTQNHWTQLTDFPGDKRISQCSFVLNGKGYIGTGFGTAGAVILSDFYSFTPGTNTWQKIADYPGLMYGGSAFVVSNKAYVLGGANLVSTLKEMWEYDDQANAWTKKSDFPSDATINLSSFGLNSNGYVGMGVLWGNEHGTSTIWSYNPSDNTWNSIGPFIGITRRSYVEGTVGKYGYYGFGSESVSYSDLWIYAPADFIP
jgi:N-acetylneuraminic acid mutarotase